MNKPRCAVQNYIRDGQMRFDDNGGDGVIYEPNSFDGSAEAPEYKEPPLPLEAADADRYNHRDGNDDYQQPGDLFRLMTPEQQGRLFQNVAAAMAGVPEFIVQRRLQHFTDADPAYGEGVAKALGVELQLQAAE